MIFFGKGHHFERTVKTVVTAVKTVDSLEQHPMLSSAGFNCQSCVQGKERLRDFESQRTSGTDSVKSQQGQRLSDLQHGKAMLGLWSDKKNCKL